MSDIGREASPAPVTDELAAAVASACAGEEDGVRVLYRWLHVPLVRYLRHHVGNEADDVASEVWLSMAALMGRFEGDAAAFRALLFTVARRRVVDNHRRNGRGGRNGSTHNHVRLVDLDGVDLVDPSSEDGRGSDGPEACAIEKLTARQAIEFIGRCLPPEQQEVILLRVVAGLSVGEVADALGKAPTAIRAAQHRAIRKLQKNLDRRSITL